MMKGREKEGRRSVSSFRRISEYALIQTANVARDHSEIVVKLMVAMFKDADGRLRYGARI